jgi:hypothetical protein
MVLLWGRQTRTPVYLLWLKKASYVAFAYAAIVKNEFEGLELHDPTKGTIPGMETVPPNIRTSLAVWEDLIILLSILVGIRVLTYTLIRFIIWQRWL